MKMGVDFRRANPVNETLRCFLKPPLTRASASTGAMRRHPLNGIVKSLDCGPAWIYIV